MIDSAMSIKLLPRPETVRVRTATCEAFLECWPVVYEFPAELPYGGAGDIIEIELSMDEYDYWKRISAEYQRMQDLLKLRRATVAAGRTA